MAVAFALALAATLPARAAEPTPDPKAPRVATALGPAQGSWSDDVAVFRGLPYAAPPVGALRWRPPQPAAAWQGLRDASRAGPACPQKRGKSLEGGGDPGELSEDCLTLNLWVPPSAAPGQKRPVMVWLHGGALVLGAGSLPIYDGTQLARQGVLVVTLNYRLGVLGTFAHPALEATAEGGRGGPVNFGLLDQIAALRWVQRRIAAFGGDPRQVTVFGQSAGAQSVLSLMASPAAQGLFQRAIAQSPYGIPSHTRAQARASGVRVAEALGLPGARATAAQLRAATADQITALDGPGLSLAPSLVIGDAALPASVLARFEAGQQARVPLLIGSNSDEATVATAFGLDPAALVRQLGAARLLVGPLYPGVTDDAELGRQTVRDLVFTAFARRIAVLQAAHAPVWRYYYDQVPEPLRKGQPGAGHGGEVAAVFGTGDLCACLGAPWTDADRRQAQALGQRWVAFAQSGRPDAPGLPAWPADTRWRPAAMVFADTQQAEPRFMAQRLNAFIGGLKLIGRRQQGAAR
jgi:para-nitrobenzyl esterase